MTEIPQTEAAAAPLVWLLVDDRPGNTTQSIGLAQALGWPYEIKQLHFTAIANLRDHWLRTYGPMLLGLDIKRSAKLSPPWPDLVITTGLRNAPVARWIKKQSDGKTVIVQIGRKGGHIADFFDLVVTCSYTQLPPHPRRIAIKVPITRVTDKSLNDARLEWEHLFRGAPHPRVALLVGGSTNRRRLDAPTARHLGEELARLTAAAGGSIFAITSRRTGAEAEEVLKVSLGGCAHFHRWNAVDKANPYLAYLGSADVIVVTGESESMLAEASMAGKPVYIFDLPVKPLSRKARRKKRIAERARRAGNKQASSGWINGMLDRFCSLLIAKGIVRPLRDFTELHDTLIRAGIAHRFGEPFSLQTPPPLREMDVVVSRVKSLLQDH